ncbi:UNVERIFIED_CONTAM: hypothetical protein K2H54_067789, partial [Gekko kuhli]
MLLSVPTSWPGNDEQQPQSQTATRQSETHSNNQESELGGAGQQADATPRSEDHPGRVCQRAQEPLWGNVPGAEAESEQEEIAWGGLPDGGGHSLDRQCSVLPRASHMEMRHRLPGQLHKPKQRMQTE